jgi:hypothetical protein
MLCDDIRVVGKLIRRPKPDLGALQMHVQFYRGLDFKDVEESVCLYDVVQRLADSLEDLISKCQDSSRLPSASCKPVLNTSDLEEVYIV